MNFRKCFLFLFAIGLVAALMAAPAYAQTRVGEAAVVKNEVLRVAGSSTIQINVGDGLVRRAPPVGNTLHGGVGLRIAY